MYKIVETPITNNYPNKIIIRSSTRSVQDLINMAVSIGLVARSSNEFVSIDAGVGITDLDLIGWVDDLNPTVSIVIDPDGSVDPTNSAVIVIYSELDKETRNSLVIDSAEQVIGVKSPLKYSEIQRKLDSTNDLLLLELEKLLPDDSPVKILREKIRNGEI